MTLHQFLRIQYTLVRRLLAGKEELSGEQKSAIDEFHRLYYDAALQGGTWENTRWLGCIVLKCPLDMWIYQEIIHETKPDVIVETGTSNGGSALFMACICDMIGHGQIISIDIKPKSPLPEHRRIRYLRGSSTDPGIVAEVEKETTPKNSVMVILDSDHRTPHVLKELELYSKLVTRGGYLIVEDTNVNGHPVAKTHGPGPMEAVNQFFAQRDDFELDSSREKFFMTFNPRGYWRKRK